MAPMLIDPPLPGETHTKSASICSDPYVVPSEKASKRIKELWWLHGHPHSKRYSNPKLVSLAALVRHDGGAYQGQEAFLYPDSAEANTTYKSMTWDEFDNVTETIALAYAQKLKDELSNANSSQRQPTIALLGGGKSLQYFCTELALQKLGVRVLLLAESNALNALHHLLKACNALAVITDSSNVGADTNGLRKLDMITVLPRISDLKYSDVDAVKFQSSEDIWERHTFIIHSSGSTGMPKPIIHTNRSMMLIARMYRLFQEFSIENWFLLFPLYHIAGISIALSGLPNGQILSFPPLIWPPSSSSLFTAWKTLSSIGHPVDIVHCAPTLIENMYDYISETGGDFSPLRSLKILQPGGAALSDSIVKALTSNGVNVKTTYGSTEIGPPFRSAPHTRDNPKCYSFRNLYPDNPLIEMEEVSEGTYECIVHKGFEFAAELWQNTDEPYRTNDLFIQEPLGSGFYVLKGRKDDILIHSNGENTSAGPFQLDVQTSSKLINRALVLGHSQPCTSLLVEVNEEYNPESTEVRDKIWQAVQKVNALYPGHSHIMKSMIFFLPKGETLPVTPKGNVKRKEAMVIYSVEIDQLYSDDVFSISSTNSSEAAEELIKNLLASLSGIPAIDIHTRTTLYDLGINSRLALSLRSSLSSEFRRPISLSMIFENPSIGKLTAYFSGSSSPSSTIQSEQFSTEAVHCIISKLEAEFKSWPPRSNHTFPSPASKETILLTGASGSLGTALLTTLSNSPKVEMIYAMVRGPDHLSKLRKALESRNMDPTILDSGKIEVVNFSMQDPLLGLDFDKYAEVAKNVTLVVQNAWKMDFNLGIEEFEGNCLRNTMSLLRLCLAGRPKRLAFTSSVSTCMGPGHLSPTVPEEPIGSDPTVALSTGYAQSKYIVERITQTAAKTLQIPIHLLRVGQLAGSTVTGCWNIDEMWPIMFATSLHPSISSIPSFPQKLVDWIPVNLAAKTISDILFSPSSKASTLYTTNNITNPHPLPWPQFISLFHIATSTTPTTLPSIPIQEWVRKLSGLDACGSEVPGLRLLRFFQDMAEQEGENGGEGKVFETGDTEGVSEALRKCEAFCGEWLEGYVGVWRKEGFL